MELHQHGTIEQIALIFHGEMSHGEMIHYTATSRSSFYFIQIFGTHVRNIYRANLGRPALPGLSYFIWTQNGQQPSIPPCVLTSIRG